MSQLNVIITGSTGMVGEGVLHHCLQSPEVNNVLVINRRSCEVQHPKLKEILLPNLFDLSGIEEQLKGYDACLFCLGISSVGLSAEDYYKTTYTLTLNFAQTLCRLNPGMTFNYISGRGTDSTEKGRLAWARVKGKTENDLMKLPFKRVFAVRPGFIRAMPGMKRTNPLYKYVGWLFPIVRAIAPKSAVTLEELSEAMLRLSINGYSKNVVEGDDIIKLGKT